MKRPFILVIDDDIQVLRALERDLRNQYRNSYHVIAANSAEEAYQLISELKLKSEEIAVFISDQRMPGMDGVTFLEKARKVYPNAKQVLITAYSDIEVAISAINDIHLDYYLLKPWNPPEEKLYPVLDELLMEWQSTFRPPHEGLKIIGFQWSPKSHALKEFLSGNLIPYVWIDVETHPEGETYVESARMAKADLP
ncbi:MAG TPA: response regulator, partial [Saprospiraceae bacterium]|nr:response regulator [Saprospiraceae bacterium]